MLVVNLNYQYATLTGDQQFPTVSRSKMAANFDNIVYMAMLHLKFNRSNSMRVRLFSGTDNRRSPNFKTCWTYRTRCSYRRAIRT